ncbi:MAG: universal stress protein [Nitrospirae bacterium]|nr:universal stress protein [Nitrospirota bacterium]
MYKNIVVAFDGSEFSKAALIESANRIKRHGGKLTIVHAVFFDEEEFTLAPEQREKRFGIGKKLCALAKETISDEFGIEVEAMSCEGEPPDVVVEIADEKNADLIAMGTYGRRGLRRMIMGSVTAKVITNSPCDVLVVKRPCSECTGEYKSIMVPFDGSEYSKKALERACKLSKADEAEVTVLYVIPRYEEMVEFFKTAAIKESLSHEAQKIIDKAQKTASSCGISIAAMIQEGNAGDKIIEIANSMKHDLIVMGTYGWKGINRAIMGSSTQRVIMNASCPVLTVK